jgi:Uma2 family endonuclease
VVAFFDRKRPNAPIPHIARDLVVEVLSKGNTKAEMTRKLGEYFEVGVRVGWIVDRRRQIVQVYTFVDQSVVLKAGQTLEGGAVLPGFAVRLSELLASDEP